MFKIAGSPCIYGFFLFYLAGILLTSGCASQKGKLLDETDAKRVGSHKAGSEVYDPAAESAVAGLLGQAESNFLSAVPGQSARRICFLGVENAGGEEMGDIREDMSEMIRTQIAQSQTFDMIDPRTVSAGLKETGLRPDDLLLPKNREKFNQALGSLDSGKTFDYILFAKVTTATTNDNKDSQVKYSLTLDLVDVASGSSAARESVALRKNYNKSVKAKFLGLF